MISRLNSSRCMLRLTQNGRSGQTGTRQNLAGIGVQKPAISLKQRKIGPRFNYYDGLVGRRIMYALSIATKINDLGLLWNAETHICRVQTKTYEPTRWIWMINFGSLLIFIDMIDFQNSFTDTKNVKFAILGLYISIPPHLKLVRYTTLCKYSGMEAFCHRRTFLPTFIPIGFETAEP